MSPTSSRCVALLSSLAALTAGCGGGGGPVVADDAAVVEDLAMAPARDMAKKADMTNLGTDPVGAPCTDASNCSGNRPVCRKSITEFNPAVAAPDGYCSNDKCAKDADCGTGGVCVGSGFCFAPCMAKDECPKVNPANYCVTVNQMGLNVCVPGGLFADLCDPTDAKSCNGTGACQRGAIDDAGSCLTTCMLGGPECKVGAQGQAQACYFLNLRVNVMGKDTGDAFAGTVCIDDASKGAAPDAACMFLNSCSPGYECNFWKVGGVDKICKKLCRSGGNECVIGTCTNAFLLKSFAMGDVGLCL